MSDPRSKRVQRVERDLFETLSHYLLHGLNEPLPCHASVTAVEINPNLRHAKVFFRLIGDAKEVEAGKEVLLAERHAFQKEVARNTSSKFCPVLRFEFGTAEQRDEIDMLFENLRKPKFGD